MHFGNFTDILGYHKTFQIVDCTMTNIQNFSLAKIVNFVPESKVAPIHDLLHTPSTNPNNFRLDSEF